MKKIIVSLFIMVSFGFYAVLQNKTTTSVDTATPALATSDTSSDNSSVISADESPTDTPTPTPITITTPTPASTKTPTPTPTATPKTVTTSGWKDGTFTGPAADAYYGNIQVKVTINSGKITDIQFLQYPSSHRESIEINTRAMPILKQEAISAQSAKVNIVTRATDSSEAFIQSLSGALAKAKS
jgi:uncharacterized protein with FMN-binding domain